MKSIEQMDRASVEVINQALVDTLLHLDQYVKGVKATLGKCTYDPHAGVATFKVDVGIIGKNGVATRAAADFDAIAHLYGLKREDLGKTFEHRGNFYKISGLNPRSRKMPVLATRTFDGKTYRFQAATVQYALSHMK